MERAKRSRSIKRIKKTLPSGRTVYHFRKKKPNYHHCGECGVKLNRPRYRASEIRKLPKVQRRPSRPLPHLCPKCAREKFRKVVRNRGE